jgi:hypothetical protein
VLQQDAPIFFEELAEAFGDQLLGEDEGGVFWAAMVFVVA